MTSSRIAILIRHGERLDDIDGSTLPVGDPPLSERGAERAGELTQRIRLEIESLGIRQDLGSLKTYTSPYRRCRETAEALRQSGFGACQRLAVDNSISEVFGPVRIKTAEPPNPWQPNSIGERPMWGESLSAAIDRMQQAFKRHVTASPNDSFALITHGDMLDAVYRLFHPKRMVYNVDYLAFLIVQLPGSLLEWEWGDDIVRVPVVTLHSCGLQWLDDEPDGSNPLPLAIEPTAELRDARASTRSPRTVASLTTPHYGLNLPVRPVGKAEVKAAVVESRVLLDVPVASGMPMTAAVTIPSEMMASRLISPESSSVPHDETADSTTPFSLMRNSPRRKGWRQGRFASWIFGSTRIVAVGSQFSLLTQFPGSDVVGLCGCLCAVELASLVSPLYDLCPTRPLKAPFTSRDHRSDHSSDESDRRALLPRRLANSSQCLRIPGVAGALKYVTAIVLFIVVSQVVRLLTTPSLTFGTQLLGGLFVRPLGLLCLAIYLLLEVIRTFPRSNVCSRRCDYEELAEF